MSHAVTQSDATTTARHRAGGRAPLRNLASTGRHRYAGSPRHSEDLAVMRARRALAVHDDMPADVLPTVAMPAILRPAVPRVAG